MINLQALHTGALAADLHGRSQGRRGNHRRCALGRAERHRLVHHEWKRLAGFVINAIRQEDDIPILRSGKYFCHRGKSAAFRPGADCLCLGRNRRAEHDDQQQKQFFHGCTSFPLEQKLRQSPGCERIITPGSAQRRGLALPEKMFRLHYEESSVFKRSCFHDYSAKVRRPHTLGFFSMAALPVQAIWGINSVPGQG